MTHAGAGVHCILELRGCPFELLDDEKFIRRSLTQAAKKAHSELIQLTSHKFSPQGVTALGLLTESHISIHTWPEAGYAAVDCFTCGAHCIPQRACDYLADTLQADDHTCVVIPRGKGVGSQCGCCDEPGSLPRERERLGMAQ